MLDRIGFTVVECSETTFVHSRAVCCQPSGEATDEAVTAAVAQRQEGWDIDKLSLLGHLTRNGVIQ